MALDSTAQARRIAKRPSLASGRRAGAHRAVRADGAFDRLDGFARADLARRADAAAAGTALRVMRARVTVDARCASIRVGVAVRASKQLCDAVGGKHPPPKRRGQLVNDAAAVNLHHGGAGVCNVHLAGLSVRRGRRGRGEILTPRRISRASARSGPAGRAGRAAWHRCHPPAAPLPSGGAQGFPQFLVARTVAVGAPYRPICRSASNWLAR